MTIFFQTQFIWNCSGEHERSHAENKASSATIGLVVHAAADGLALGAAGASEVCIDNTFVVNVVGYIIIIIYIINYYNLTYEINLACVAASDSLLGDYVAQSSCIIWTGFVFTAAKYWPTCD